MSKQSSKSKKNICRWQKSGRTNRHHNLARCKGGTWSDYNIFVWDINAHRAFHFLFGNRTLLEASAWLKIIDEQNHNGIKLDILDGSDIDE